MSSGSSRTATLGVAALGRLFRRKGSTLLAVALLVIAGGALAGPSFGGDQGGAVPEMDYGDAPDSERTYEGLENQDPVEGSFPSLRSSNGARHTNVGPLRLGMGVDKEPESVQVDGDGDDDGLVSSLVRCRESTVRFRVNASDLPRRLLTREHTAYLNAWFDFNVDGDWQDVDRRCGKEENDRVPEWLVENARVGMARFREDPIQMIPVTVKKAGGSLPHDADGIDGAMWHRASLTLDEKFAVRIPARSGGDARDRRTRRNDGRGLFKHGETEDYGAEPDWPYNDAFCDPDPADANHDEEIQVAFAYTGEIAKEVEVLESPFDVVGYGGLRIDPQTGKFEHAQTAEGEVTTVGFFVVPKEDGRADPEQEWTARFRFTFPDDEKIELECGGTITHQAPAFGGGGGDEGGGGGGDTGGTTKCNNGVDNDSDGLIDAADPGCQTGPGAAYDPQDHSEDNIDTNICTDIPVSPDSQTRTFTGISTDPNIVVVGHILRNMTSGQILLQKTSSDGDFASGSMSLGTQVCGEGTTANLSWSVSGNTYSHSLQMSKNSPAVTPPATRIVSAENTR